MGVIKVENIRVFAHHGCLKEETIIGSNYRVDVEVKANLKISAKTDELHDTVDYVLINQIVKEEMATPSKLLETVVKLPNINFNKDEDDSKLEGRNRRRRRRQ